MSKFIISNITGVARDISALVASNLDKVIVIEEGDYVFSTPVVVPPGLKIRCEIIGDGMGRTRIRAQKGAFHARSPMRIRDLTLWRSDDQLARSAVTGRRDPVCDFDGDGIPIPNFGMLEEANVTMSDVGIEGFTIGIYIWADGSSRGTNANAHRHRDVVIKGCGLTGIAVRGRDSNAGLVEGCRIYSSGEHATFWEERDAARVAIERLRNEKANADRSIDTPMIPFVMPTDLIGEQANMGAGGISDHGFLGSTYLANLISSSHETVPQKQDDGTFKYVRRSFPAFRLNASSAASLVLGHYHESDQAPSILDRRGISIGGLATEWNAVNVDNPTLKGLRIDGPIFSSIVVTNHRGGEATVRMGEVCGTSALLELIADAVTNVLGNAVPYRIEFVPTVRDSAGVIIRHGEIIIQLANQLTPVRLSADGMIQASIKP